MQILLVLKFTILKLIEPSHNRSNSDACNEVHWLKLSCGAEGSGDGVESPSWLRGCTVECLEVFPTGSWPQFGNLTRNLEHLSLV